MPEEPASLSKFGTWFSDLATDPTDPETKRFNPWSVSQKSGVSHVQIGKLIDGTSGTRRPTVEKIVSAIIEILGITSDEEQERILADGLIAAGFLPNSRIVREQNEDVILADLEAYEGSDPRILAAKGAAKGVAAALDNAETMPPSPHLTGEIRRL